MTTSPFGKQVVLGGERSDKNIWTSIKIDRYLYNLEHGIEQETAVSPFFDRKLGLRKGNINFQYSKAEEKEIEKCMNDIVYFANNYCFAMTDEGVKKITLRDYQKVILKQFAQNRYIAYLASRQIGKCFFATSYISTICDDKLTKNNIFDLYNSNKKQKKSIFFYIKTLLFKAFNKLK